MMRLYSGSLHVYIDESEKIFQNYFSHLNQRSGETTRNYVECNTFMNSITKFDKYSVS